jgi:hypothetical protein
MSEETAREIAEREIGRADDKRKTPERRSYRTGNGRRRDYSSKNRPSGPAKSGTPAKLGSSAQSADQRRFNRS